MSDHPTPASAGVAALLALAAVYVLASVTGLVRPALFAAGGGLALAVAGLLGARETVPSLAVSSVLFVVAVGCSVVAVTLTSLTVLSGIEDVPTTAVLVGQAWQSIALVFAAGVAAFGAWTVPRQGDVAAASRSLAGTAAVVCTVVAATLGLVVAGSDAAPEVAAGDLAGEALSAAVEPDPTAPAPGTFLVLGGAATFAVASLLDRLPLAAFAGRERRETVRNWTDMVANRGHSSSVLLVVVGAVLAVLPASVWSRIRRQLSPAADDLLVTVTTAPALRRAFLWAVAVSLVVVGAVAGLRRLRREYLRGPARLLARASGGLVLVGTVSALGPASLVARIARRLPDDPELVLDAVVSEVGVEPIVFGSVLAGCLVLSLSLYGVGFLGVARIVPPGTAAAVVAAVGVGAMTVVAGLLTEPSPLLFGTIAAAVVVWDAGAYGQRLGTEVGPAPTRRAELVHVGAVSLVGVVSAVGVYAAAGAVRGATQGTVAAVGVVALLAAVFLAAGLRG